MDIFHFAILGNYLILLFLGVLGKKNNVGEQVGGVFWGDNNGFFNK